jgi:hypothetical protein
MKHPKLAATLLLFLLAAKTQAQQGDWQVVKNLPPGAVISVRYEHFPIHIRCIFQNATDDRLDCARILHSPRVTPVGPELSYERNKIREVRLEHSDTSNTLFGAAIGAAVGGALGAARSGDTHAQARVVSGLIVGVGAAMIGGFLGREFPARQGKVIYRH